VPTPGGPHRELEKASGLGSATCPFAGSQGELLGLKWADLDLKKGTLSVRRSLRVDKDGAHYTEGKRDRSRRRIELGAGTVAALRAHRKRQLEERVRYADLWEDNDLVFCQRTVVPFVDGTLSESSTNFSSTRAFPKSPSTV